MPITYEPKISYYNGNKSSSKSFFLFDYQSDSVTIYNFVAYNITETLSEHQIISASEFFDKEIPYSSFPVNVITTDISAPPYLIIQKENNDSIVEIKYDFYGIPYSEIEELNKFNLFKNNNSNLNLENLYLTPIKATKIPFSFLKICDLEANQDILITFDGQNFGIRNQNEDGKVKYPKIPNDNHKNVMVLNTGFGNNTSFDSFNIIVSQFVGHFLTNKNSLSTHTQPVTYKGINLLTFDNRLKLKVTGPTTANVGDIIEFDVSLMNNDFSQTISNAPSTLECYPVSDAGIISHRKLILKNGVGKFKIDTRNLYSGDVFDVKVGWKYITTDSKVSVTIS